MNENKIRYAIMRGWGNAYIGWENNKVGMFVINDWDRMANIVNLTNKEKENAINLMSGSVFDRDEAEYALMKFKENQSSTSTARNQDE